MNKYQPREYWDDRLTKDFSLGGVGFLGLGIAFNEWLYKARLRALNKLLHKHRIDPYGMRILDIGIGTGFYINFWERLGVKHITGLDITRKSISELTVKYPQYTFIRRDISEELSIKHKFDIIIAFDVFFHIVEEHEFEKAISNIKSISHTKTFILISDNFLKEYRPKAFHKNDRTMSRYKKVLVDNGFYITDIQPIFYFSNAPVDLAAIKSKAFQLLLKASWSLVRKVLSYTSHKKLNKIGGKSVGFILGWLLYHIDGLCLRYVKKGVSTKLLLARVKQTNE